MTLIFYFIKKEKEVFLNDGTVIILFCSISKQHKLLEGTKDHGNEKTGVFPPFSWLKTL